MPRRKKGGTRHRSPHAVLFFVLVCAVVAAVGSCTQQQQVAAATIRFTRPDDCYAAGVKQSSDDENNGQDWTRTPHPTRAGPFESPTHLSHIQSARTLLKQVVLALSSSNQAPLTPAEEVQQQQQQRLCFFLTDGSLLGAYRHVGHRPDSISSIAYDYDADIAVVHASAQEVYQRLNNAFQNITTHPPISVEWKGEHSAFVRVWGPSACMSSSQEEEETVAAGAPAKDSRERAGKRCQNWVDVFIYQLEHQTLTHEWEPNLHAPDVFPLQLVPLDAGAVDMHPDDPWRQQQQRDQGVVLVPVPRHARRVLETIYGKNFETTSHVFDFGKFVWQPRQEQQLGTMFPLVSTITVTRNRAGWLLQMLRALRRQDYPNVEVIIVDDSDVSVVQEVGGETAAALAAFLERHASWVRYTYVGPARLSVGEKRNIGADMASGQVIVHWDDDDWMSPHRITRQVAPILANKADVTAFEQGIFVELPQAKFYMVERVSDMGPALSTLAFSVQAFAKTKRRVGGYPKTSLAEDYTLCADLIADGARFQLLENSFSDPAMIYVRTGRNTWKFREGVMSLAYDGYAAVTPVLPPPVLSEYDHAWFGRMLRSLESPKKREGANRGQEDIAVNAFVSPRTVWSLPQLQPRPSPEALDRLKSIRSLRQSTRTERPIKNAYIPVEQSDGTTLTDGWGIERIISIGAGAVLTGVIWYGCRLYHRRPRTLDDGADTDYVQMAG